MSQCLDPVYKKGNKDSHLWDVGHWLHLYLSRAYYLCGRGVQDLHCDTNEEACPEGHTLPQSLVQVLMLIHQSVVTGRTIHIHPSWAHSRQEPWGEMEEQSILVFCCCCFFEICLFTTTTCTLIKLLVFHWDRSPLPLSPSFAILRRSMKWVPMATSFTLSESRIWTFNRLHKGGNISVKTTCSFQMGS